MRTHTPAHTDIRTAHTRINYRALKTQSAVYVQIDDALALCSIDARLDAAAASALSLFVHRAHHHVSVRRHTNHNRFHCDSVVQTHHIAYTTVYTLRLRRAQLTGYVSRISGTSVVQPTSDTDGRARYDDDDDIHHRHRRYP
jgi:hypothetical protein